MNKQSEINKCVSECGRTYRAAQSIEDATRDFLAEGLVPAEAMISSLVDCQLAHINTSHPDFVGGSAASYRSTHTSQ